jgi:enoyl-CoA hydratase
MTSAAKAEPTILLDVADGVAWLTYSNPLRRNAVTPAMCDKLVAAVAGLSGRDDVRAVVVRGAGERSFVAGADINSLSARSNASTGEFGGFHALRQLTVPVIAMIGGPCYGGGVVIALDSDIRIASAAARFAIPAARLGVGYDLDETAALVRLVGTGWAARILFTGQPIGADTALAIGLVEEVVAPEVLEARVRELAATIVANAPLSVRAAKAAIRCAIDGMTESRKQAAALIEACSVSADFAEGREAFREKRSPRFTGR